MFNIIEILADGSEQIINRAERAAAGQLVEELFARLDAKWRLGFDHAAILRLRSSYRFRAESGGSTRGRAAADLS